MQSIPKPLLVLTGSLLVSYGFYRLLTRGVSVSFSSSSRSRSSASTRRLHEAALAILQPYLAQIQLNPNSFGPGGPGSEGPEGLKIIVDNSDEKKEQDVFPSVKLIDFAAHYEAQKRKIDNDNDYLDVEMEVLNRLAMSVIKDKLYAPLAKGKDRYQNVIPYQDIRVKLKAQDEEKCTDSCADYINASPIKQSTDGRAVYIAAQAPVVAVIPSFWRMMWEQDSTVIVMLTRETESNHEKASRYWPDPDQGAQSFGQFTVKALAGIRREGDVIVRKFEMWLTPETNEQGSHSRTGSTSSGSGASEYMVYRRSSSASKDSSSASPSIAGASGDSLAVPDMDFRRNSGALRAESAVAGEVSMALSSPTSASSVSSSSSSSSPASSPKSASSAASPTPASGVRFITQLQYIGWRDFGTPDTPSSFYQLMTLYRRERERVARGSPIVVHCSAGIGRTGTFIALDQLLDQIQAVKEAQGGNFNQTSLNIFRTVFALRQQRAGMVQTRQQYEFIYSYLDYCIRKHLL